MDFVEFLKACAALFATLAGVASFVVFLVNFLKAVRLVKDGTADIWFKTLNFVAFVLLVAQQLFFPQFDVMQLDKIAGLLAELGKYVLPMVLTVLFPVASQFGGYLHSQVRGVPIFGSSYSRV